jgi:hypothetical protein
MDICGTMMLPLARLAGVMPQPVNEWLRRNSK